MIKLLENYEHRTGGHCASTSIASVCRYLGFDWSEGFCFGVGGGIFFFPLQTPGIAPEVQIFGRQGNLEQDFCVNSGLSFRELTEPDPKVAWKKVTDEIDRELAPLLRLDLYYLKYYQARSHFNGHILTLVGYDDETGEGIVSDSEFEQLQRVSVEEFEKARYSSHPPAMQNDGRWFTLLRPDAEPDRAAAARGGIKTAVLNMLGGFKPLDLMKQTAEILRNLNGRDTAAKTAKVTYQLIERRGTGGGFFRFLFRDFLAESRHILPEIAELNVDELLDESGKFWTRAALHCLEIAEGRADDFSPAADLVEQCEQKEREAFETLADVFEVEIY